MNDRFYVVNKKFWDTWVEYSKSQSNTIKFSNHIETKRDKEGNFKIDNESLFKLKSSGKVLAPLRLHENVEVVPPRLYEAFESWYGESEYIKRTVI